MGWKFTDYWRIRNVPQWQAGVSFGISKGHCYFGGPEAEGLYEHKAGVVELHPGDKVLVKLDAFRGQQWKLKNWWGDALHMVVKHMVDGIPAYEVENELNKKRQVLHQARLLLWLAKPEGEPLRINRILIKSGLIGAELVMALHRSVNLGVVPHKLIYGVNTAMFESRQELPDLMMDDDAWGALRVSLPWRLTNSTNYRLKNYIKPKNWVNALIQQ